MVEFAGAKPLVHLVQNIYLYAHRDGRTFTIYIQRDKQDHTHDTCTCSLMVYKIKTALLSHQLSHEPSTISLLLRIWKPLFVSMINTTFKKVFAKLSDQIMPQSSDMASLKDTVESGLTEYRVYLTWEKTSFQIGTKSFKLSKR